MTPKKKKKKKIKKYEWGPIDSRTIRTVPLKSLLLKR